MRRIVPVVVVPLALWLAACGADGPTAHGPSTAAEESLPAASQPDPGGLYEGNGTVCEDATRGPRLWLGGARLAILGSPHCGGIPLVNWDWQAVDGEAIEGGTTYGTYHVVGRYEGETLAVTDVGPYEHDPSVFETDPDTTSPCDEPEGGWIVLDPAHNTQNEVGGADAYARSQPDYVASWNTHLEPERLEFGPVVFNVVFTGDAERHEAEIRKVWEGPLCVVAREVPTARELGRVRKEVEAGLGDLGLQMLWSSGPAVEPVIEIGVVADVGGNAQAALDARYGPGVVRLIPALKPVS
jgi:hypothetical protein